VGPTVEIGLRSLRSAAGSVAYSGVDARP